MQLCRKCGTRLDVVEEGQQYHPLCTPTWEKLPGTAMSIGEMEVREDLLDMIHWTNNEAPRTQQVALGCSEAGHPCDRKVAYKMANEKVVNAGDPLKANMGTAFHHWLDNGMSAFQQARGLREWVTETEVWPADFLKGHVDLYSHARRLVLDWKTTSADILKGWKQDGIPQQYLVQVMLYGKGIINRGWPVDRVGLVGISRSGSLRDIAVLTVPYDDSIATAALRRVWNIGKQLVGLPETPQGRKYADISGVEDYQTCRYCPFYRGGTAPADATGCPGKTTGDPVTDLFG